MAPRILSVVDVFNNLFEKSLNDFFSQGYEEVYSTNFPPLDVYLDKEKKDLRLDFALAGYNKEDIDMNFDGDYLTLEVKPKKEEKKEEGLVKWKSGIKKSAFSARYYIPLAKYEHESAVADFKDGILSVFIPAKSEMARKKLTFK